MEQLLEKCNCINIFCAPCFWKIYLDISILCSEENPTVHPSSPFSDQVVLLSGFRWTKNLVPSGTRGVFIQSNWPNKSTHTDNFGFFLDVCRTFKVNSACGINLSYSRTIKNGSTDARPALRWFLNICTPLSTLFAQCIYRGTNWYSTLSLFSAIFKSSAY